MPLRGKVQGRDFPTSLVNPGRAPGFPLLPPPLRRLKILISRKEEIAVPRAERLVCCLRGNGLTEQKGEQLFKYSLRPS